MSTSEAAGHALPPVPRGPILQYWGQVSVHGGPKLALFAAPTCPDAEPDSAWVTSWGKCLRQAGVLS